jgi:4-hydroxy-3-methylbut-2-enyl diphosphate reductase
MIMLEKIIVADHHGFCMGVKRAINIADDTAHSKTESDVTILKEIVHNNSVVQKFRDAGVKQEFDVDGIDSGTVVISAHGVSPNIIEDAKTKGLNVIDATCPLVTRIHEIVDKLMARDYYVIHFGDAHHDETLGVVRHAQPDRISVVSTVDELRALPQDLADKVALTSQAPSEVAAFEEAEKVALERWPEIKIFNTVCNATTQRQSAIVKLADQVDMILVVGSTTSANSQRLCDIAEALCGEGHLIENAEAIDPLWLESSSERKITTVGVSAGASTPDFLIEGVIERLSGLTNGSAKIVRSSKRNTENELTLLQESEA